MKKKQCHLVIFTKIMYTTAVTGSIIDQFFFKGCITVSNARSILSWIKQDTENNEAAFYLGRKMNEAYGMYGFFSGGKKASELPTLFPGYRQSSLCCKFVGFTRKYLIDIDSLSDMELYKRYCTTDTIEDIYFHQICLMYLLHKHGRWDWFIQSDAFSNDCNLIFTRRFRFFWCFAKDPTSSNLTKLLHDLEKVLTKDIMLQEICLEHNWNFQNKISEILFGQIRILLWDVGQLVSIISPNELYLKMIYCLKLEINTFYENTFKHKHVYTQLLVQQDIDRYMEIHSSSANKEKYVSQLRNYFLFERGREYFLMNIADLLHGYMDDVENYWILIECVYRNMDLILKMQKSARGSIIVDRFIAKLQYFLLCSKLKKDALYMLVDLLMKKTWNARIQRLSSSEKYQFTLNICNATTKPQIEYCIICWDEIRNLQFYVQCKICYGVQMHWSCVEDKIDRCPQCRMNGKVASLRDDIWLS